MDEWIELLTVTRTLTTGHYTETVTVNGVWAEERSVTRSEFYQAYAAGLKAEKAFKVNTDELGAASYVRQDGVKYKILINPQFGNEPGSLYPAKRMKT